MPNIITSRTQTLYSRSPSGPAVFNRGAMLAQGLVAWFPLNDARAYLENSAVYDMSGRGNNLTVFSPTQTQITHRDGALATIHNIGTGDASQRFFRNTPIITGAPCSFAAWIRPASASVTRDVIRAEHSDGYSIRMRLNADQIQAFYTDSSFANSTANSTANYTVGTWHNAAAVFASSSSRAAFLNGASKGIDTTSRGSVTLNGTTYAPNDYDGGISDICFWNRALTDAEVYRLYDPGTRWELYYRLGRTIYFDIAGAAAGGGFKSCWAAQSNTLIAGGIS